MGLEEQAAVKRVADEHQGGVVVLLGTPDVESTQTLAQTVVSGDPSYAGPLAGVPLGLPVVHIFEPQVKAQIPAEIYEGQVALTAMGLDTEGILAALDSVRAPAAG
jgi:glycine reductase